MHRFGARSTASLLALGLLAQALPSFAEKPVAPSNAPSSTDAPTNLAPKLDLEGPEAEAKDRARVLFQQGVAAYRAGKYYDAVEIFLQTQRIYPDTQLCFNVARAYEMLGNVSAALRYYRDYLRQADRPSDGDEVKERVQRLEQQLAERGVQQLTVLSQPDAAIVILDGRPVGLTPWTGETYPGKHRLRLTLEQYVTEQQVIEVDAYAAHDVSLALLQKPVPPPPVAPRASLAPSKQPLVSLASLVTLGVGAAFFGSAIVAQAASSQAGLSRTTAFLAGSGLGVSAVGGVMLYFDLAPGASKTTPREHEKDSASADR
jgi:tetratricopeptide (TPR) repeat protein